MWRTSRHTKSSYYFPAIISTITFFLFSSDLLRAAVEPVPGAAKKTASKAKVPKKKKLIFLNFYNQAGETNKKRAENLRWMETSIGIEMHKSIKDKYTYIKVTDSQWQSYVKKNKWRNKDLYNQNKIRAMGLHFGADGIVYGKFSVQAKGELELVRMTGSILSVIDNEVIATQTFEERMNPRMFVSINSLANRLGEKIKSLFLPTDFGALRRSAVLPGWGQYYKQRKTAAYIWGGLFVSSALFLTVSSIKYLQTKIDFDNYDPGTITTPEGETAFTNGEAQARREFDELQSDNDTWGTITLVSLGTVVGIYLLNLIDAYIFEGDYVTTRGGQAAVDFDFSAGPKQVYLSNPQLHFTGRASYRF